MRCKALADEFVRMGHVVRFVCRPQAGDLIGLLSSSGFDVTRLPTGPASNLPNDSVTEASQLIDSAETIAALGKPDADWLIVDNYELSSTWERALRPYVGNILAIDDLANRNHDCDVLVDQNWYARESEFRYKNLAPPHVKYLLGPRYALLQPVFSQLKPSLVVRSGEIRRILVFFGAVDSTDQTSLALKVLSARKFAHLAVDIVVGHANNNAEKISRLAAKLPHAKVHRPLASLAGLMARADLMLGAGGSVTWERCTLGLPAIIVHASENQRGFAKLLAGAGAQICLGQAGVVSAEDWSSTINQLMEDASRVSEITRAASRICDGFGVYRVTAAISKGQPLSVLRRAAITDENLLLDWANDTEVRQQSFSSAQITPKEHRRWLLEKLADPDCMLLIGLDKQGLPIGQVRFDCRNQRAEIDISVDSALRGNGLGKELLTRAIREFRKAGRQEVPVAEIKESNLASLEMFRHAGFVASGMWSGRNGTSRLEYFGERP